MGSDGHLKDAIIVCEIILISYLLFNGLYQSQKISGDVLFWIYACAQIGLFFAARALFQKISTKKQDPLLEGSLFLLPPLLLLLFPVKNLFYSLVDYLPLVSLFIFASIYLAVKLFWYPADKKELFKVTEKNLLLFLSAILVISVLSRFLFMDSDFLNYHGQRQYQTLLIAKNYFLGGIDLLNPKTDYAPLATKNFTINGLEFEFMPLISQVIFALAGISNWSARIVPVAVGIGAILLFYLLQERITKDKITATLSALIFSCMPLFFFISRAYMPEIISIFFILAFMHFYLDFKEKKGGNITFLWLFLSALCVGLSKPPLIMFLFFFAAYEVLLHKDRRSAIFFLIFAVVSIVVGIYYWLQVLGYEENKGNSVIGDYFMLGNLLGPDYYLYLVFSMFFLVSPAIASLFAARFAAKSLKGRDIGPNMLLLFGVVSYALLFSGGTWGNTYYLVFWTIPLSAFAGQEIATTIKRRDLVLLLALTIALLDAPVMGRFLLSGGYSTLFYSLAENIDSAQHSDPFIYGVCAYGPKNTESEIFYLSGRRAFYVGRESQNASEISRLLDENDLNLYVGPVSDYGNLESTPLRKMAEYPHYSPDCEKIFVLYRNTANS